VHVVVNQDDQADLAREIENAVERRVGEAGDVARDLRRDELLWIVNSPIPEKTPGNVCSTRRMCRRAYMSVG
jgi:hypothetical protein